MNLLSEALSFTGRLLDGLLDFHLHFLRLEALTRAFDVGELFLMPLNVIGSIALITLLILLLPLTVLVEFHKAIVG